MRRNELIQALRQLKVQTGSLACLGCGHEHNCSIHGCAIIRTAVEELEEKKDVKGHGENKKILRRDYSEEFDKLRKNRIIVSHHKYGWMSQTYPELAQAHKCIEERLDLYRKTGNKEYLIDAANFCMIEFIYPAIPNAKMIPTDSDKSPGLAGGISFKQLMEGM